MRPVFRYLESLSGRYLKTEAPVWSSVVLAVVAATLIGLITWKTAQSAFVPGTKDQSDAVGHFDFGYATYFPVRDFLAGNNPYEPEYADRNPDGEGYPAYSPIHLALHLPFGCFSFEAARWLYFAVNLLVFLAVATLVVRIVDDRLGWNAVLLVAVIMLASRPGYKSLFYGQSTALVMLGSYLALWKGRDQPWLAGLGLALVSIKAQYLVPLGFFMLIRGNVRAVFSGALLSILGSLIPAALIVWSQGGLEPVMDGIYRNYITPEQHPGVLGPGTNWSRIDAADQLAKWSGKSISSAASFVIFIGILILGALVLLRTRDREDLQRADGGSTAFILGLTLLSVYHLSYDLLFLTLPLVAILCRNAPFWKRVSFLQWWVVLVGFGLGFANHAIEKIASSLPPGSLGWRIGGTINSIALLAALGLLCLLLLKTPKKLSG